MSYLFVILAELIYSPGFTKHPYNQCFELYLVDYLSPSHLILFLGFCPVLSFGTYFPVLFGCFYELGKTASSGVACVGAAGVLRKGALTFLGRPVGGAQAAESRESHSGAWSFSCGGCEPQVPGASCARTILADM